MVGDSAYEPLASAFVLKDASDALTDWHFGEEFVPSCCSMIVEGSSLHREDGACHAVCNIGVESSRKHSFR